MLRPGGKIDAIRSTAVDLALRFRLDLCFLAVSPSWWETVLLLLGMELHRLQNRFRPKPDLMEAGLATIALSRNEIADTASRSCREMQDWMKGIALPESPNLASLTIWAL
jgi:hypothetical protein